ncbi:hypothetical protein O6H91_14G072800 [Diphasiastrum complanatum]|uniref:Uncharacterized protein n=1 Tax=Diphasiastrum complanatum TaxID=34168 RepID=A0ACC2BRR3_DIPCM|nr:hypothetical protein O6H91_14G072800 [Diphasiastrum complanatum]
MKERRQSGASEAPYGKMAPQQRPPSRPRRRRERNAGGILAGMFMGLRGAIFCAGFSVLSVSLIVWAFFWPHDAAGKIRAISPLPVPKVLDLAQFQGKHKESLFWGTYRPHLYFGIRSRTPKSLLAGLMWLGVKDGRHVLRHVCEDSDNLSQFGWLRHDGSTYGRQEIVLSTYFLKSWDQESGYGGDWSVRIKVESASKVITESRDASSIFFYVVNEDGGAVNILGKDSLSKGQVPFATGHDVEYGNWELHLKKKTEAQVNFAGIHTSFMHNLTQLVWRKLEIQGRSTGRLQLSDDSQKLANMAIFQVAFV